MLADVMAATGKILAHPAVWIFGALWGALMIGAANYLAEGYTGPRERYFRVLTVNVLTGIALFMVLAGPTMLFGSIQTGVERVWFDYQTQQPLWWHLPIVLAIGFAFGTLARLPPVGILLRSRLYASLVEAQAMLSVMAYFATQGTGSFVPPPVTLMPLAAAGGVFIAATEGIRVALFPQTAGRLGIALAPLLVWIAAAPYAAWLQVVNQFRG